MSNIYHYSTLGQCRTHYGQSQKCPKAEQCDGAPRFCECYTLESHAVCNFASSLHSTGHSNHGAYMQRIYALPSHKPAGNFLLQITAKRCSLTIANTGKSTKYFNKKSWLTKSIFVENILIIKIYKTWKKIKFDLVNFTESSFPKKVQKGVSVVQNLKVVKARTILIPYTFHFTYKPSLVQFIAIPLTQKSFFLLKISKTQWQSMNKYSINFHFCIAYCNMLKTKTAIKERKQTYTFDTCKTGFIDLIMNEKIFFLHSSFRINSITLILSHKSLISSHALSKRTRTINW